MTMIEKAGEELDGLGQAMFEAEAFANTMMRDLGWIPFGLFIHTPKGVLPLTGANVQTEEQRQFFIQTARLLCIQHKADATALVTTFTLQKSQEPGELSALLGSQETVALVGESRRTYALKLLPVICYDNGTFHALGEAPEIRIDSDKEPVFRFLSTQVPDEAARLLAKQLLGGFGNMGTPT